MTAPVFTIIKRGLAGLLSENEAVNEFTGGRVFINRFDPCDDPEYMSIGVFVLSEERVETDVCRDPDMRSITVQVEVVSPREKDPFEEALDAAAELAEAVYLMPGALKPLGELLIAEGYADSLLEIRWERTDSVYVIDSDKDLGMRLLIFTIEYEKAPKPEELPDFREAFAAWRARLPEGPDLEAEGGVVFEE